MSLAADAQWRVVTNLLGSLESQPPKSPAEVAETLLLENKLVQVRLGLASTLFSALRARHAPTAAHSLRVALCCSAWATLQSQSDEQRDEIEVAALLHDIGKLGVPDSVLLKPETLSPEEFLVVEGHRRIGAEILRASCTSNEILRIVEHAGAWFDGSREGYELRGERLPLGARMLAIVDAFDAMTSDKVYRRALSRERALAELFEYAGTQFDPRLVQEFCTFISSEQAKLQTVVARRWLKQLQPETTNGLWRLPTTPPATPMPTAESLFHQKLLESMHDAVIFVDGSQRIVLWNRAAERLTGIPAASIEYKQWSPKLVSLRDEQENLLREEDCPVLHAVRTGVQTLRRLNVTGRNGQRVDVDAHLVPVHGKNGISHGAALLMHDASSQVTLEQRVQSLHERATRDPLTQVANRAEFDRCLEASVESHLERHIPCSLIICDIDHFKRINDSFGHQAGDEVLISFAALLRRHSRAGDLVGRYGGEEFVLLCADCDNATATARAEQLRIELAEFPMRPLEGKSITASFGVTELQSGDTPETMLRRADRALYQAKASGRNAVVQLGSGIAEEETPVRGTGWFAWLRGALPEQVLQRTLATSVPLNVVIEKIRGFVADHHAQIDSISENHLVLCIEGERSPLLRRNTDRPMPFLIEAKVVAGPPDEAGPKSTRTLLHVTIRPQRSRDRRRRDVLERAQQLLISLKSYLVAHEFISGRDRPAAAGSSSGRFPQT